MEKIKEGFTLIELLVVIAIIGLLATIVLVSLSSARAKGRDARRVSDLKQIEKALEMFYDNYGRYPITGGHTCWSGHWGNFQNCLQSGTDCWGSGTSISNYISVMAKVPQDPLGGADPFAQPCNNNTYYTGWEGRTDQNYILRALLETNHPALASDADGGWRSAADNGCNDPWYCIKKDWPY